MNEVPAYTRHHPRWYRERVSTYWWIWKRAYRKFILRELSSLSVAWFVILTLRQIRALARGPEAYAQFQTRLESPLLLAVNGIAFLFVLFHAVTWFNLTPRAMAVRVRGKRVPDLLVAAPNYVAWLAISAALAWLLVGR